MVHKQGVRLIPIRNSADVGSFVLDRRMADTGAGKMSRDDRRKQKELEEARKLGNAPAEVDEEGK